MPVGEYSLRLQHGITGGFAPPTPNAIYTITQPLKSDTLVVTSAIRADGTPSLQDFAPKHISNKNDKVSNLVEELHSILKELPTEQPPGSQDIYGLDTSIAWGSDDLEWMNGSPQGCGGGISEVQATEEQKAKFRRAVDIVTELTQIEQ
ncbi:hypothetical protein HYPSUDRAFT_85467 [Hypholoma sublateritium FD-334 SS-4]|uniref:Uncharacterized protein n=1 Tax=Hypholoma sublateritium (strain FD-334 SS-4) TaxID=945553 RepID=A0A0D2Q1D2_HYPSF|nr:hypothetical protein HYPSUDRAFT_85467 [Hypholoma sublateritium FD-334 SS-4]